MKIQDTSTTELTTGQITGYLQAQLAKKLKWETSWDHPNLNVSISSGCPRYPVEVSIHSLSLDRQAAIILNELGVPDALATSGSYRNFNDDYLSLSRESLIDFGKANKEKIIGWTAEWKPQKPLMQQLYEIVIREGIGYKLDYLIAASRRREKAA